MAFKTLKSLMTFEKKKIGNSSGKYSNCIIHFVLPKHIRDRHELIIQTYLIMSTTCGCLSGQCGLYICEKRPHSAAYLGKTTFD